VKGIATFRRLACFALVKMGISIPQRFDWQGIWSNRGQNAEDSHPEIIDGRPSEHEINAISAVEQQLMQLEFISSTGTWLDIGVGSGLMRFSLQKKFPMAVSIACDYSYPTLSYCKSKYDCPVVNCVAEHLPICTESIDFILFYSVSHYLQGHKDFLEVIREFGRVLKPGGVALIGDVLSYVLLSFEHFNPRWFFPNLRKVKRDIKDLDLIIDIVPQPEYAPYRDQRVDWLVRKEVGKGVTNT